MDLLKELLATGSPSRRAISRQVAGIVILLVVGMILIFGVHALTSIRSAVLVAECRQAVSLTRVLAEAVATSLDAAGPRTANPSLDRAIRTVLALPDVVNVRIWRTNGALEVSRAGLARGESVPSEILSPTGRLPETLPADGAPLVVEATRSGVPIVTVTLEARRATGDRAGVVELVYDLSETVPHHGRLLAGLAVPATLAALLAVALVWRFSLRTGPVLERLVQALDRAGTGAGLETLPVPGREGVGDVADPSPAELDTENEAVLMTAALNRLVGAQRRLTAQAQALASDDLGAEVLHDLVPGELGVALRRMVDSFRGLIENAQTIARGEISTPMLERSSEGDIGKANARMLDTLRRLALQAQAIANGDLASSVLRDGLTGELGTAFSRMVGTLRDLIGQMMDTAALLESSSRRVEALCTAQLEASAQQASSVNETSAAIEEMDATASQIAETSHQVLRVAQDTLASAEQGKEAVSDVAVGIQNIRTFNQQSTRLVADLGRRSQKIGEVLGIINEIAGQTKLLSLNAAIEAARAGEAGRGFAIVAIEVRKLADNVVRSTHEIEKQIADIRAMVGQVVESTTQGQQRVEGGVEKAERAGASLIQILEMARKTTELAQQITVATQQQKCGSDQIVSVMRDMVGVCTKTADNARETTQAAAELGELASTINKLVARFTIEKAGSALPPPPASSRRVSPVTGLADFDGLREV